MSRQQASKMLPVFLMIVLILGIGLYALAPHPPATPKRAEDAEDLGDFLQQLVESRSPPGLSITVVKDGNVVLSRGFGFADEPRGLSATPDTVYHWWSMTKIVTAIAVLQLRDRGRLRLDDPVGTHLPWFAVRNAPTKAPLITIRNLLQHTSGLRDTVPAMIGWVHYDEGARDQTEIARLQLPHFNRLKFTPGTRSSYSNLNYMLLGAVIEAVAAERYEDYVREHILVPLAMNRTDFVVTESNTSNEASGTLPIVHPYTPLLPFLLDVGELIRERRGKLFWMNRVYIDATPSTGLIGPVTDVARLMIACLDNVSSRGPALLTPDSFDLLVETPAMDGRGLGWHVGESGGRRFLEHAGGGPGFATIMRVYPNDKLGLAMMSNGTDLDRAGLVELATGLLW